MSSFNCTQFARGHSPSIYCVYNSSWWATLLRLETLQILREKLWLIWDFLQRLAPCKRTIVFKRVVPSRYNIFQFFSLGPRYNSLHRVPIWPRSNLPGVIFFFWSQIISHWLSWLWLITILFCRVFPLLKEATQTWLSQVGQTLLLLAKSHFLVILPWVSGNIKWVAEAKRGMFDISKHHVIVC